MPEDAARFENLVDCHPLKGVHFEQDTRERDLELRYFRDVAGDRSLHYLKARFPDADAWRTSATGTKDHPTPDGVRVAPALRLLAGLV